MVSTPKKAWRYPCRLLPPRVVSTGPLAVSHTELVRQALGYPRQFESVAGTTYVGRLA
jgi:hypothetical protein